MSLLEFRREEEAVFKMRSLYQKYGYSQYKMNKFEEYDLYATNKDFLISKEIITFTDKSGKLLALKPDVTLSIVKNFQPKTGQTEKVYYHENVYRVSGSTDAYKEIMQVGIECQGEIDDYCIYEVLMLAAKSLDTISRDWVLDLSCFGLLSDLIDSLGVDGAVKKKFLNCIGEKNSHELKSLCEAEGIGEDQSDLLCALISHYSSPEKILPELCAMLQGKVSLSQLDLLKRICLSLDRAGFGEHLRIDFSVVSDTEYYNGIVFRGFVKSIPTWILSGGQYDRLMQKMNKKAGAIGFAVYLDLLEEIASPRSDFDVDALLLYPASAALSSVASAVEALEQEGKCVIAQKTCPKQLRYKELYRLEESGVKLLERNA